MLPRTQDEIVARIEERKRNDIFGFETFDYIDYLDFEHARPYLEEGTMPSQWAMRVQPPVDVMYEYMDFAWEKANGQRGLSAMRSIAHYTAWLWLAGEDDLLARIKKESYGYYGKPILRMICDHFGWDWHQWENS